jgi:hypothetical protein
LGCIALANAALAGWYQIDVLWLAPAVIIHPMKFNKPVKIWLLDTYFLPAETNMLQIA